MLKKSIRFVCACLLLATVFGSLVVSAQEAPRTKIKTITDYVVYYGKGRLDDLARFDLAIIQPDTLTAEELAALKANGTLVVAYLSVGEAEPGREWYSDGRVDPRWLLGKNENWGSYFVDASKTGWQQLMVELTGEFIAKGFDGVFLDTVDTVDAYPQTTDGMIALIDGLRKAYPDALLVQNRGFTVIGKTAAQVDAVMFEDLITSYDFQNKEYIYADNTFTAGEMAALSKRTGLPILALDYAPPDNPAMAYLAVQAAKKYGFVSAVSTIFLDDIPDYGLDQPAAPDIRIRNIKVNSDGTSTEIVVTVENIGLLAATTVPVSLSVNGEQIAKTSYDKLDIGQQQEWHVPWASAAEKATLRATAFSLEDRKAGNNSLSVKYTAEAVAVEPILPLDQQRHRPAANGPDLKATALTALLTIDGDLTDWADMPCTEVNTADQISFGDKATWTGADDLSGHVCYAWDSENLYVGFDIADDVIVQKYTDTNIWRGDHVELWFDTQLQLDFDSAEPSADDFQIGLSPGDFDKVPPDIFIWQPATLRDSYINSIKFAVKRTDKGYSAEMQIPALVLKGIRLASDQTIGATFDPSDTDTPGSSEQEMMLSTAPHTQWGVPTLWNNLTLTGNPTVTATASVPATAKTPAITRTLVDMKTLPASNVPSDVTAIIGYTFYPGDDVSKPITEDLLEAARETVRTAASEGALWLDADMGITNFTDAFLYDPALTFYPLAAAILDEAHKHNIKVFFYFSGTEIETPNYPDRPETSIEKVHPDWMQIDQFGKPMTFLPGEIDAFWLEPTTADAWANPLAPGFREAIMTRAEGIAKLGADGIFVDVPYYYRYEDRWADFSDYSATAFKAATGFDLPKALEKDGKAFWAWLEWRETVWRDYFAEMRSRVQAVNPNTLIISEEYPGSTPSDTLGTGFDPAVADAAVDVVAHEYGHKQDEGGAVAYTLDDWRITRDTYKWYQGMARNRWSLCYATNAPDSRALAAITYAHQLSFWETKAPTMLDDSAGTTWRKDLLAWIKAHGDAYNGAAPAAEVAVVYSNHTRNLTYGANIDTLISVQHALDAAQIPYVVLTEPNIARIQDFPYVILPTVTYATEAVQAEVAKYAGKLILVGNSLTRDTWDEQDVTPPSGAIKVGSAAEAAAQITTTPLTIENGDGLMIELFRKGEQMQIRVFNPKLNAEFEPTPQQITVTLHWAGETPTVKALDFMGAEATALKVTAQDGAIRFSAEIGLFTLITIE
ncbi:MAG: endo alpha-1,4 polygalactosaminidase [Anaerolineae bacterium]|nr:endo alpha-1,4 polygalactosaminidase [Anaerolineae bacterium]